VVFWWPGQRSFVADRTSVVRFDRAKDGVFWLAGQGGYGIMTSSAIAEVARVLIVGTPWLTNSVRWVLVQLHLLQLGIQYRKLSGSFCS